MIQLVKNFFLSITLVTRSGRANSRGKYAGNVNFPSISMKTKSVSSLQIKVLDQSSLFFYFYGLIFSPVIVNSSVLLFAWLPNNLIFQSLSFQSASSAFLLFGTTPSSLLLYLCVHLTLIPNKGSGIPEDETVFRISSTCIKYLSLFIYCLGTLKINLPCTNRCDFYFVSFIAKN